MTHNKALLLFVLPYVKMKRNRDAYKQAKVATEKMGITKIPTHLDLKAHLIQQVERKSERERMLGLTELIFIKPSTISRLSIPETRRHLIATTQLLLGHTKAAHQHLFIHQEPLNCE
ncbi:hypothetical protein WA026_010916 [Henosepilachna vigintioctopunctata]|uniref:Uncharacterized protein n=1 Tax=Henosepilachna vigintioctopunctata TaxID=420089 RepID=A0AAW1UWC8_9CUCU